MKVTCPKCQAKDQEFLGDCSVCGAVIDPKEVVRPIGVLLSQIMICRVCGGAAFDGWYCYVCTYTISDKAKKAHPCFTLNDKERQLLRNHFNSQPMD